MNSASAQQHLQISAGVDAVQLFDTWAGCLSVADFRRYVLPHTKRLIEGLSGQVPVIYFGTGNGHLLDDVLQAGPDVLALDWRVPLGETWDRLGCTAVQGNLDPIALCADRATVASQAQLVLDAAGGRAGHIFNLGHGVPPKASIEAIEAVTRTVKEYPWQA